jgi:hypothetical protein
VSVENDPLLIDLGISNPKGKKEPKVGTVQHDHSKTNMLAAPSSLLPGVVRSRQKLRYPPPNLIYPR